MKLSRKQRKQLTARLFDVCRNQLQFKHYPYLDANDETVSYKGRCCTKQFEVASFNHFYKTIRTCNKQLGKKRTNQILQQVLDENK